MIFKYEKQHAGIVLLRLIDKQPQNKIIVLKGLIQNYGQDLWGNFVVVTEKNVLIIKLSFILLRQNTQCL